MDKINLRSKQLTVTAITKQTKARLFKDFREGTVFILSVMLRKTTGAANGLYALDIEVHNITTDEIATFSQNEVLRYIACFEFNARGNQ